MTKKYSLHFSLFEKSDALGNHSIFRLDTHVP